MINIILVNLLVFAILVAIVVIVIVYIVKEKKKGVKCIGCPSAQACASNNASKHNDNNTCHGEIEHSCSSCKGSSTQND